MNIEELQNQIKKQNAKIESYKRVMFRLIDYYERVIDELIDNYYK